MSGAAPLDVPLLGTYRLRSVRPGDGAALAAAYERNREHLAPWEPTREPEWFTVEDQERRVALRCDADAAGSSVTAVIVDESTGDVVGSVNLNDIVLGAFRNGNLGYWTDARHTGRGLMTSAAEAVCAYGRELGLHRVQAATLLHNAASQQVLRHTGFTEIGVAPAYLRIAGSWQDHVLFQRILVDPADSGAVGDGA